MESPPDSRRQAGLGEGAGTQLGREDAIKFLFSGGDRQSGSRYALPKERCRLDLSGTSRERLTTEQVVERNGDIAHHCRDSCENAIYCFSGSTLSNCLSSVLPGHGVYT